MYWFCLCLEDVFSYDEDDMVEDPNLAQHLAHFGINIAQMEKVLTHYHEPHRLTSVLITNAGVL